METMIPSYKQTNNGIEVRYENQDKSMITKDFVLIQPNIIVDKFNGKVETQFAILLNGDSISEIRENLYVAQLRAFTILSKYIQDVNNFELVGA